MSHPDDSPGIYIHTGADLRPVARADYENSIRFVAPTGHVYDVTINSDGSLNVRSPRGAVMIAPGASNTVDVWAAKAGTMPLAHIEGRGATWTRPAVRAVLAERHGKRRRVEATRPTRDEAERAVHSEWAAIYGSTDDCPNVELLATTMVCTRETDPASSNA